MCGVRTGSHAATDCLCARHDLRFLDARSRLDRGGPRKARRPKGVRVRQKPPHQKLARQSRWVTAASFCSLGFPRPGSSSGWLAVSVRAWLGGGGPNSSLWRSISLAARRAEPSSCPARVSFNAGRACGFRRFAGAAASRQRRLHRRDRLSPPRSLRALRRSGDLLAGEPAYRAVAPS